MKVTVHNPRCPRGLSWHNPTTVCRCPSGCEAQAVCELINRSESRRTTAYVGSRWMGPSHDAQDTDTATVSVDHVFDADGAARQLVEDESKGGRKRAYESAKKQYDSAVEGCERVACSIRQAVADANDLQYQRDKLTRELARYVELAGGDERIALRFLSKAYPQAARILPALFVEPIEVAYEPAPEPSSEQAVEL